MVSNDGIIGNGTTDLWRRLRKLLERWPTEDFKKGITDMNLGKHKDDTLYAIRHNMRMLPQGRKHSNEEIDPERSKLNESIVKRGDTPEKVNEYRKQIESELFHYNRKDLVHSIEMVITLPEDCPPEQEHDFWVSTYEYVASTLPMGERAIFLCEIHRDEGRVQKDGVTVVESPAHMHIMFVPAVPDQKHEGFKYKLCADQLTKRSTLQQWHPRYQKWLDNAGIKATVHNGKTGGKNISVEALKKITKETGLTIDQIKDLKVTNERLRTVHQNAINKIKNLTESLHSKDAIITNLQTATERSLNLTATVSDLQQKLSEENSRAEGLQTRLDMAIETNQKAEHNIAEGLQNRLDLVTENNRELRQETERQKAVITELQQALEKQREAERTRSDWNHSKEREVSNGWGNSNSWNKEQEVKRSW